MIRLSLILLCVCILSIKIEAQDSIQHRLNNSIGINVTSLLAEVISIGDNNNSNKFNIIYTYYGGHSNFRLGANFFYNKESENNPNIGSGTTTLIDQAYKFRMGYDIRNDLSSKFNFAYGFDVLYLYSSSKSDAESGFININTKNSYGIGPVLRFEYNLSKRISLMTESTLYFLTGSSHEKLEQLGLILQDKTTKSSNLTTTIPSVLYLNVHF
jgi:hypothetical protein